jgi:hypothetical protein
MPQTTTVRKDELIKKLEDNRQKHKGVFEAALEGWRTQGIAALERKADALRSGKVPDMIFTMPPPEDHTRDYDRVIAMVTMDTAQVWTMTEQEFAWYVQDDWAWKRQWLQVSNKYAAGATQSVYAAEMEEGYE